MVYGNNNSSMRYVICSTRSVNCGMIRQQHQISWYDLRQEQQKKSYLKAVVRTATVEENIVTALAGVL